jgi:sugar/nucleoside kinase (ribokinase family)
MELTFIIAGQLKREYVLPPAGRPLLDAPGGNLLYTAAGAALWTPGPGIGLIGRVGEDYPRDWLGDLDRHGFDAQGIHVIPGVLDLRLFLAYGDGFTPQRSNPVSQFARRQMSFPKALLGYQPPDETSTGISKIAPNSPHLTDIPDDYVFAKSLHLCAMDYMTQSRLIGSFKLGAVTTITLSPSSSYMNPRYIDQLRPLVQGLTAFIPSEQELRALFWGRTHDLWEMAEAVGSFGCEFVLIKCGAKGQLLLDVVGRQRWEIPAYSSHIMDPTGAGDVFCGGFMAGYRQSFDPLEATLYGNVAASLSLEGSGAFYVLDVLPGLAQARVESLRGLVRRI